MAKDTKVTAPKKAKAQKEAKAPAETAQVRAQSTTSQVYVGKYRPLPKFRGCANC